MQVRPDIKFYDTSAVIKLGNKIFDSKEKFLISFQTLKFLKEINNNLIHLFENENNKKLYELVNFSAYTEEWKELGLDKVTYDAYQANNHLYVDEIIFITGYPYYQKMLETFLGDQMIQLI